MKRNRLIVGGLLTIALIFIVVVLLGRGTSEDSLPQDDDTKTHSESFEDVFDEEDGDTPNSNDEASKEETKRENTPSKEETDGEKTPTQEEETETDTEMDTDEKYESENTGESPFSETEDTETKYGEIY